jgi:hypothetical protein
VLCTFGTNHVCYHGDVADKVMDPLISRLHDTNVNRLHSSTLERSTVVWVGFSHPDFGVIPLQAPPKPLLPYRAELIETNGTVTRLKAVSASMQHYRRKELVVGWEIAVGLEAHRGSMMHIEATNGIGSISLRVN